MAALLHRGQAQLAQRGHRIQLRGLHGAGQRRPDRQVRQYRKPHGRVHHQTLRRQAGPGRSAGRSPAGVCGCRCRRSQGAVRRARVRQGDPRDHGAGRPGQPVRRPAGALADRERQRPGRRTAPGLHHRHRPVQEPHRDAGAGAAPAGERSRRLAGHRCPSVGQLPRQAGRGPPGQPVPAPDAAGRPEAARGAVRATGRSARARPARGRRGGDHVAGRRGDRSADHHRRLQQDRPADRQDRQLPSSRRLDQAAAPDARRRRRT